VKIGLLNLEPKYHNYALDKLRVYWLGQGAEVEDYMALAYNSYDRVYCSSIFSWTPKQFLPPNAICGGTGFNLTDHLPADVEEIKPHLNYGFTTRGCIRNCQFCVVPKKEGWIEVVGDLLDLWDGKAKEVTLYDNNILAIPGHFYHICQQAFDNKIRVDFNQGLDHRLITAEIASLLAWIRHPPHYRMAFDHPGHTQSVGQAIDLLQEAGIRECTWYVLVGFNTTPEEDLFRLNYLRDRGQSAFVQRYNMVTDKRLTLLAQWANQHDMFRTKTWEQFLEVKNG
jgi:hypothetical protein